MKKIFYILVTLLLFSACRDKELLVDPFEGADSYIYSFGLKKGNETFRARIVDGKIILTVPNGTSLDGATPVYELCEKAAISPSPEAVESWEAAIQFTVTSYSGKEQAYSYSLVYSDVSSDGDIVLLTQQDVDNMASSNITFINGDLTIGEDFGQEFINNLDGLTGITGVKGAIVITEKYMGENIDGLASLTSVGSIRIGSQDKMSTIALSSFSLPKLKNVSKDIVVYANNIKEVGLSMLENVYGRCEFKSGKLFSFSFPSLKYVGRKLALLQHWMIADLPEGMSHIEFPLLEQVGDLDLSRAQHNNHISLYESVSFPRLVFAGSITVNSNMTNFPLLEKADGLSINQLLCPVLKRIEGNVAILGMGVEAVVTPALEYVGGNISGFSCPVLKFIGGNCSSCTAPLLERVEGVLTTTSADELAALAHLNHCGGLTFKTLAQSTEVLDLSRLTFGSETIAISSSSEETMLKKIIGPQLISGQLYLSINDTRIFQWEGFNKVGSIYYHGDTFEIESIEEVTGRLNVSWAPSKIYLAKLHTVGSFEGSSSEVLLPELKTVKTQMVVGGAGLLPKLESVGDGSLSSSYVVLQVYCNGVSTVIDMPVLKTVNGNCVFSSEYMGTAHTTSIKAPLLESIGGYLQVGGTATSNNYTIASLDFSSLRQVNRIEIKSLNVLKDFSSFAAAVPVMTTSKWRISGCGYNPTYQDMVNGKFVGE